ncbi:MAG: amidoligase enzyme [Candidatus Nitrohelix vancouverensis]|uniref:Amidoligase enzyme n=1 Tax=Candidatus Nitrohelix vancouverensis TaxID=2705534 RepID=A0A7T0G3M2_9BACT|nr:MAG: amidoligase enzyme [Candidatus Nitrohelix vancouverensis]
MKNSFIQPPRLLNDSGEMRKVGFELEFAAQDCLMIAEKVREIYGGDLEKLNQHYYKIIDTDLGDFSVQLDTQIVHPDNVDPNGSEAGVIDNFFNVEAKEKLCELIGDVGKVVVPYEVVTAPIPLDRLDELNVLIEALQALGAEGTDESFFYAFGVHINPEAPSLKSESILRHLQAFLLLSDWLHEVMNIDLARRISPYINTFPRSYAKRVLSPGYTPDRDQLIEDYLAENPTRNRELDFLPLFTHVEADFVQERLDDGLTSARPTYHYRLPDCRLNDADWSLSLEWNFWVQVERLADDPVALRTLGDAYLEHFETLIPGDWGIEVEKWMEQKNDR